LQKKKLTAENSSFEGRIHAVFLFLAGLYPARNKYFKGGLQLWQREK
jgi:hypothetical protein